MSISFQSVSDIVLGTWGKSKARGLCSVLGSCRAEREVNLGKENPGSQTNTIINKPGDRESQNKNLRATAAVQ